MTSRTRRLVSLLAFAGVAFGGLSFDFQDLVLKPLADSAAH